MDGIKKRALPNIPENNELRSPIKKQLPQKYYPKKEELFITKEEAFEDNARYEKEFQKGRFIRKIFFGIILFAIFVFFSCAIFFFFKAHGVMRKINTSQDNKTTIFQDVKSFISPIVSSSNENFLQGEEAGRINILLLGAAGDKKPGGNLTDTVMIMSVDVKNKKVAMLSLPRDFYVQIPNSTSFTKINNLYRIGINEQKGAELIKEAVEKITAIKINYYLAVDFDAFQKIIDNIGGVNIVSERDIYDPKYPGPNYSYETFSLSKGFHLLDGATALKYVRERHDDPQGDFGRAKRQQQVIQAIKNKLFSMQTFFNVVAINNVLATLGDNVKTDMNLGDIERMIKLSKVVDTQNIENVVVDAWKPESLLKVSHVMIGNDRAFILVPRVGNYSEIQDLARNIFNQTEIKRRQEIIKNENASIAIINQSNEPKLSSKIKILLSEKLGIKNVYEISNTNGEVLQASEISSNFGEEKIFTLDELIKKLPAKLDTKKIDSQDNITVKLGNDLIDIYKYEEDSMMDLQNADDNQFNTNILN